MLYIFDIDGTLIDSIKDVATSSNFALEKLGCPTHPVDFYRSFMGYGFHDFMEAILPLPKKALYLPTLLEIFEEKHQYSHPYDGITDLVTELKRQGHTLACLSNKPDAAAKNLTEQFFKNIFSLSLGSSTAYAKKPSPEGIWYIMKTLSCTKEKIIFIGDTMTDIETAKNAGVFSIGVTWGYGEENDLRKCGSSAVVQHPLDILKIHGKCRKLEL